ncbi:single-stranded DNA-binding protein [Sanguibacter sp. HDW7]|uniref:single-stranded DNA-binding protein n=1 Tax=Sanguibacter sp. HDW7 TaxID=2714931 RepID=UPI0014078E61|nr:single-stranded DNA-binding protein [Sanguibacter sp. HDW7]QIK83523.1 single-stranded DNA-binding protein [Sanguibacter sp. HDW7]
MPTNIHVMGNLTSDPELRVTPSGHTLLSFTVAENSGYRNAAGEYVEHPTIFWPVTAWGEDMAKNAVETLRKGDRVMVVGETIQSEWQDKTTGDKRSRIELRAREVAVSLRRVSGSLRRPTRREDPALVASGAPASAYDSLGPTPDTGSAPF